MVKNKIRTSKRVAKIASRILRDNRFSAAARSAAGSALSNRRRKAK